jgi:hypothetical protein
MKYWPLLPWNNVKSIKSAFSLVECCITLALCSLICMLTLFNWSLIQSILVHTELDELCSACRFVQHCTLATQTKQHLVFDVPSNSYAYAGHTHHLSDGVMFAMPPGAKGPPATPTHLIKTPITFDNNCITFSPAGIINAGTVYLMGSPADAYALSSNVAQVSHIRKYRYNTPTWTMLR